MRKTEVSELSIIRSRILSRCMMPIALVLAMVVSSAGSPNGVSGEPRTPSGSMVAAGGTVAVDDVLSGVPAVKVGLFFHVGFAVADLNAAMTRFTKTLDIKWRAVLVFSQPVRLENGEVRTMTFHIAFSEQGPPYIELVHVIDPVGVNPWTATRRSSPSHFGYAVNDLQAASNALVAAGFPRIATADVPGQSAAGFAYHRSPGGIVVELLDGTFAPPGVCDTAGSPFCSPSSDPDLITAAGPRRLIDSDVGRAER
jgi:Glyoxalase/Bleomycin resistance protein/Dioxygenase superfamily